MRAGFEPLWVWGRVSLHSGQGVWAVGSSLPAPAPACDVEAFGGGLGVPNLYGECVHVCLCVRVCIHMHCVLCACVSACVCTSVCVCVSAEH